MNDSFELLRALKNAGYPKSARDPFWWPRSGTFWVVVGAILTQQTKWEKVEKSIENLETCGVDRLDILARLEIETLAECIKPSGFYNTKAKNLRALAKAILETFNTFETFQANVTREWLLAQKGVGEESADSILCYACYQEAFVVDAYTARFLNAFGYDFESYEALQSWMLEGLNDRDALRRLYAKEISLHELYARFHGKIVEYCKENSRGKVVDVGRLGL